MAAAFWSIVLPVWAGELPQRTHSAVGIFINNHKYGGTNGGKTELSAAGWMKCGAPGHVSKVTWKFLRSTPQGDIYAMTRTYPLDSKTPSESNKEITFAGKPVLLWEDNFQKISLFPISEARKSTGPEEPRRPAREP